MMTDKPKENETAFVAYQTLVGMLQHDDILFFRRFELYLLVNGVLFTLLGLFKPSQGLWILTTKVHCLILCGIAIFLCMTWLVIIVRGQNFYDHWLEQLKFLEKEFLPTIQVFRLADQFFTTGEVMLGSEQFNLGKIQRHLRIMTLIRVIPILFLVGWIILGLSIWMAK